MKKFQDEYLNVCFYESDQFCEYSPVGNKHDWLFTHIFNIEEKNYGNKSLIWGDRPCSRVNNNREYYWYLIDTSKKIDFEELPIELQEKLTNYHGETMYEIVACDSGITKKILFNKSLKNIQQELETNSFKESCFKKSLRFREDKSNDYKYYVTRVTEYIKADNYQQGTREISDYKFLEVSGEFNSLTDIIRNVSNRTYAGEIDWWEVYDNGENITLAVSLQTNDYDEEPTEEEYADWENGDIDLYRKEIVVELYKVCYVSEEDCEKEGITFVKF